MTDAAPRLTAALRVSALLRLAEVEGGFGAVLFKGDATAGAILLVLRQRGENPVIFERLLGLDGGYAWQPAATSETDSDMVISRRRQRDPDLWVVELDVVDRARFIAETMASN